MAVVLGMVAIAAGAALEVAPWRLAPMLLGMAMRAASQPNAPHSWLNLIDIAFATRAVEVSGLLLVGFGLCALLIALHHWGWNGTPDPEGDDEARSTPPEFVPPG